MLYPFAFWFWIEKKYLTSDSEIGNRRMLTVDMQTH